MPNATELRELDDDELETRLSEYRRELLNLRFQLATGQLDNVSRMAQVRKDVARVLTILRDRDIAVAEGRDLQQAIPAVPAPPRPARRRRDTDPASAADPVADTDPAPAGDSTTAGAEPPAVQEESE